MAQLVVWLLPNQRSAVQIQSSAKIYFNIEHLFAVNCVLKRQNKEKEAGNGPFFNCLLFLAFHWHNRLPLGLRQTFISFYERAPWQNLKHVKVSDQKGLFLKKLGHPRPLFRLFSSFQTNITIPTTNIWEKMLWPPCIRRWDSNPWLLEYKSAPITTRPWLPHYK